ncbi:MAG: hypothetical protein IJA32_00825 [Lachnospiraceae bacterium]|nr:hypothetical protein [Lachnospiraceae bacterium]
MSEPYKEVFVLHVYEEVKLREIASMYEIMIHVKGLAE